MPVRSSHSPAFSLAEVLLALGVVSFALVALMSLLPVGLKSFRQADITMTEAQIAQSLVNQFQLAGFTNAVAMRTSTYNFTRDGHPVSGSNGSSADTVYTVTVRTATNVALPNAATGGKPSANILSVLFFITCKSSPQITNVIPAYISNDGS